MISLYGGYINRGVPSRTCNAKQEERINSEQKLLVLKIIPEILTER